MWHSRPGRRHDEVHGTVDEHQFGMLGVSGKDGAARRDVSRSAHGPGRMRNCCCLVDAWHDVIVQDGN